MEVSAKTWLLVCPSKFLFCTFQKRKEKGTNKSESHEVCCYMQSLPCPVTFTLSFSLYMHSNWNWTPACTRNNVCRCWKPCIIMSACPCLSHNLLWTSCVLLLLFVSISPSQVLLALLIRMPFSVIYIANVDSKSALRCDSSLRHTSLIVVISWERYMSKGKEPSL